MRVVDGLTEAELERLQRQEEEQETAERQDEEEERFDDTTTLAVRRYGAVIDAVERLVNHRDLDEERLAELSGLERRALDDLAQVIKGRGDGTWYYAEDRLLALNRTLAILQPVLSLATLPGAQALMGSFETVRDELSTLRERLVSREYAEEELYAYELDRQKQKPGDDDDDEDDPDAPADGDAPPADGDAPPADGDAPPADGDTPPADGDDGAAS